MKNTRSYFTLAAVALLAGTACSADEAEAEPQGESAQSQEQAQDGEETPEPKHPQETAVLPPADDSGYDRIPEFEHSVDGDSGMPSITKTHIEIYHDIVSFMDEQGIVADEASLAELGAYGYYGRAATELEYWGTSLSIPNHNDGNMSTVEITLDSADLGFETDERSEREEFADELLPVIAESPHIDRVRNAKVIIQPGDGSGVGQVGAFWTEKLGYTKDL